MIKPSKAVERAMQPGQITRDGFLGNDPRPLADILSADQAGVERLGVSHAQLARRMIEFRDAGQQAMGDWVAVSPHWEVQVETARGKLPCPFGDPGLYPKTHIAIRDTRTGAVMTFTDLLIHLIGEHGFYEGRGSVFRVEPSRLVETLELSA